MALSAATGRRLTLLVVVLGVCATVLGTAWAVRATVDWRRSAAIQAGPHVLATIDSVGRVSGHHQQVVLRYQDQAGAAHTLPAAFPLGMAHGVIPGMTTTVAYDRHQPERAEIAFHPRFTWQHALLAAALTALLTAVWLRWALRLAGDGAAMQDLRDRMRPTWRVPRTGDEATPTAEPARQLNHGHLAVSAAVVASLLFSIGRLGLNAVATHPPQAVNFPPDPPALAATSTRPASLPAVLTEPPPHDGPVVSLREAEQVVAAVWPLRDHALAERNVATLRELETGPALTVDLATMDQGFAPNRPNPTATLPPHQTYVPRQTGWPASFLAEVDTTNTGKPWLEVMVFQRKGPASPWQVAYDTGYVPRAAARTDPPTGDTFGYNVATPITWTDPRDAVGALARYWQSWLDTGRTHAGDPTFAPGLWTTDFLRGRADGQGKRDTNGLPGHYRYSTRSDAPVWVFGVYTGKYDLVCSPMQESATWTGPAHQDAHRQKWGRSLAPGVYRSVTTDSIREPCVLVPTSPGPLIVFGADIWHLRTHGVRR